jgi:hypothetical protein
MKNICFFNHWHNGDVFAGKGWMQDIQRQLADRKFAYSHINKPKIMSDLDAEYFHCDDLPEGLVDRQKFADSDDEFYVNTWIGSYGWDVMPRGEDHANWLSLHRMFEYIYQQINSSAGANLTISNDPLNYVASTNWSAYDISAADQFVAEHSGQRLHLICNGLVRSTQSNLGTMKTTIDTLAEKYPNDVFVCTAKFDTERTNIYFTDDIFANVDGGDLNEIGYLSTKCSTIVGKNSGPFMFAHVKENIFDENKVFVSLSHRASDCYPWGLDGIGCVYLHCSSDDEVQVVQAIDTAIQRLGTKGPGKVELVS